MLLNPKLEFWVSPAIAQNKDNILIHLLSNYILRTIFLLKTEDMRVDHLVEGVHSEREYGLNGSIRALCLIRKALFAMCSLAVLLPFTVITRRMTQLRLQFQVPLRGKWDRDDFILV